MKKILQYLTFFVFMFFTSIIIYGFSIDGKQNEKKMIKDIIIEINACNDNEIDKIDKRISILYYKNVLISYSQLKEVHDNLMNNLVNIEKKYYSKKSEIKDFNSIYCYKKILSNNFNTYKKLNLDKRINEIKNFIDNGYIIINDSNKFSKSKLFELDIKNLFENLNLSDFLNIDNGKLITNIINKKDGFDSRGKFCFHDCYNKSGKSYQTIYINIDGFNENFNNTFKQVFLHELGHYIHLTTRGFNEKGEINSNESIIEKEFLNISWDKYNVLKKDYNEKDFVSGYSMKNYYEDFAETFLTYLIHYDEFEKQVKESKILKKKFFFMKNNIFKGKKGYNLTNKDNIKSIFYDENNKKTWDITTINIKN